MHRRLLSDAETHRATDRDVRITGVETTALRGNPTGDGHHLWGLVKVETDAGVHGVGETYRGPEPLGVVEGMARHLVGQNPMDPARLADLLRERYAGAGTLANTAITALETACHDVKGKVLDVPVYELLGGKYRDEVLTYCDAQSLAGDAGEAATPEAYAAAAEEAAGRGFDLLKFDLDVPTPTDRRSDPAGGRLNEAELDYAVSRVAAVRDAVGESVDLGVDLHWQYTVETATRLGRALSAFDLAFVEDPVRPEDAAGHRRVREAIDAPLLAGENLSGASDFADFLAADALDVAAPDVTNCGGLATLVTVGRLCELHDVPLAPHNLASPVGTVAGAHACAAVPNVLSLEYRGGDCPWWEDVVERTGEDGPVLDGGRIPLPEGPGLGVELSETAAEYVADGYDWPF